MYLMQHGKSPLWNSCDHGQANADAVRQLIHAGADVNATDIPVSSVEWLIMIVHY